MDKEKFVFIQQLLSSIAEHYPKNEDLFLQWMGDNEEFKNKWASAWKYGDQVFAQDGFNDKMKEAGGLFKSACLNIFKEFKTACRV